MTTVYFIRHGTTENNIAGRFQGRSDIPLGREGTKAGGMLGRTICPYSAGCRVHQSTSARVSDRGGRVHAFACAAVCCDGLREIDGGALEGRTNDENIRDYPDVMRNFREHPAKFNPPDGESAEQVHARVLGAIEKIVSKERDKTIAIVSHGFALLCSIGSLGIPFDALPPQILANASVSCIQFDQDGSYRVVLWNDQSHLPEQLQFHSPFWKEAETKKSARTSDDCNLLPFGYKNCTSDKTDNNAPLTAHSKSGAKFFSGFETHPTMWIKKTPHFCRKLAEATGQRTHPILDKMGVLWYYKLVST